MPLLPKTLVAIAGAELPERGVPWCRVTWRDVGAGRHQPTLEHRLNITIFDEAPTVGWFELIGAKDPSALSLQELKCFQGMGEFFLWSWHRGHLVTNRAPTSILQRAPTSKWRRATTSILQWGPFFGQVGAGWGIFRSTLIRKLMYSLERHA